MTEDAEETMTENAEETMTENAEETEVNELANTNSLSTKVLTIFFIAVSMLAMIGYVRYLERKH